MKSFKVVSDLQKYMGDEFELVPMGVIPKHSGKISLRYQIVNIKKGKGDIRAVKDTVQLTVVGKANTLEAHQELGGAINKIWDWLNKSEQSDCIILPQLNPIPISHQSDFLPAMVVNFEVVYEEETTWIKQGVIDSLEIQQENTENLIIKE